MASFFKNICRFNQCGLEYASLYDLIQHIEENHIVNDAECQKRFELLQQHGQQPAPLVSLSFICRYYQKLPDRKPKPLIPEPVSQPSTSVTLPKKRTTAFSGHVGSQQIGQVNFQSPAAPSVSSSTITSAAGSELDEDSTSMDNESLSSDSTVVDDAAADPNYTAAATRFLAPAGVEERRFMCPVPGCKKKYKNINGVRYHSKIAHQGPDHVQNVKAYKCGSCNKAYKTPNGLHNHQVQTGHKPALNIAPLTAATAAPVKQQTAFPAVTLLTSSTPTKGAAIRVSPAPSPSVSLTGQNPGLKLTSSSTTPGQIGTIPSGVSIQVQPAPGSQMGTTVHVPQQGATAGSPSVLNVSVFGPRSFTTTTGMKRSSSTAQLGGSGRPLKIPAAAGQRTHLVHNLMGSSAQQYSGIAASSQINITESSAPTTIMGPPATTVSQYLKQ